MTNLTIGQRIDMYEVLESNTYDFKAQQKIQLAQFGQYIRLKYIKEDPEWHYYNFHPFEVKKVGTFIVKSLKGVSNA